MPFLLLRITKSIAHENDLCRGEHQQQKPQILCNYSTQQYRKPFSFSPLTHEHLPHNERAERPRSLFARQPVECLHGFQRPPSEDDENREFQGISPPKPHSSPRQRSPPPFPNSNARDSRERYSLPLFLTHVGRL